MKGWFKIKFFILLTIVVLFVGCASIIGFPRKSGIFEQEATLESGIKIKYTISIPETYSRDKSIPLILALHYGGKVTPFYGKGYVTLLVKPALNDLEAIIAAPDCPGNGWANPEVEKAVMEFLEIIIAEYKIDRDRILITGYSMGGIGTWYLASRHPDVFSAAIPVSAIPDPKETPVVKDLPFFVIHSRDDEIFSIDSLKKFIQMYRSKGGSIQFFGVQGISHYETYRFVNPLKDVIPWIKKIWEDKN